MNPRRFTDEGLASVYRSWRGAYAQPLAKTARASYAAAYRQGFVSPKPFREPYRRNSAPWAAWAAGVDDKLELEATRPTRPPAQLRMF